MYHNKNHHIVAEKVYRERNISGWTCTQMCICGWKRVLYVNHQSHL